ncbi:MAG: aminoacyl-tRNA hydrolase [Rhabdochlamydiaceae bacterium]|nr:aminoacyl-tRNA hydrolase [Rhabdochlamydiaceae bacterium]
MKENHLIVGLGNPGKGYQDTRHNVGFQVVQGFAKARGICFRHSSDFIGEVTQCEFQERKMTLLLPTTYMNSSGDAVRRCIAYYKIPVENLIIVCDDIALDLGMMRIRARGSDGGHNGLKSVAAHLGTQYYARFRIGVGSPEGKGLADYVLGRFTSEEKPVVEKVVEKAIAILELWMTAGIAAAMQKANARDTNVDNKNSET